MDLDSLSAFMQACNSSNLIVELLDELRYEQIDFSDMGNIIELKELIKVLPRHPIAISALVRAVVYPKRFETYAEIFAKIDNVHTIPEILQSGEADEIDAAMLHHAFTYLGGYTYENRSPQVEITLLPQSSPTIDVIIDLEEGYKSVFRSFFNNLFIIGSGEGYKRLPGAEIIYEGEL